MAFAGLRTVRAAARFRPLRRSTKSTGITFRNVVYRPLLHQVHNGTLLNSSDIGAVYIDETAREIDIVARSFALQSRGLVHRNVQINNLGGAAHPFVRFSFSLRRSSASYRTAPTLSRLRDHRSRYRQADGRVRRVERYDQSAH